MSDSVQQQYGWQDTELTEANNMLIPEILKLLPQESVRVLDLGCGNGTLAAALQARGHDVVAVDASADGVELAKERFPGIRFETVSVYDDGFADIVGTDFDVVISMEVIEHLYWPRKLLEAGYSVLKPGARMILTTPYHGYLKNLALSLAGGWDKHFTVDWDGGHIKFFSRQTLTQFMQDQGFHNIDFRGVGRISGLWKSMTLSGKK
ncbi:class I SAM-dependent methyltransferase [Mariprofundus sp. KV]|uniref:class I SAM-dependent methyltransferase n=1 Tax=Mariprofundus sp. KV TaxID=2608715 RepID=UPI00159FE3BC|nr:class I SAM-dependent methyltransferase [Mariprofundus sp. KV]